MLVMVTVFCDVIYHGTLYVDEKDYQAIPTDGNCRYQAQRLPRVAIWTLHRAYHCSM